MRIRNTSMLISLLAASFSVASPSADAQSFGIGAGGAGPLTEFRTGPGPRGGVVIGGVQGGPGQPAGRFNIFIAGPDGLGQRLLQACDGNQDGAATLDEVKAALQVWFQRTDADTNAALDIVELSTAVKEVIPPPQPPPGFPAPPEEFAPHNLLARHMMMRADASKDGLLTLNEASAYVEQNYASWDSDNTSSLASLEFEVAFHQLVAPDESERVLFEQGLPPGGVSIRVR